MDNYIRTEPTCLSRLLQSGKKETKSSVILDKAGDRSEKDENIIDIPRRESKTRTSSGFLVDDSVSPSLKNNKSQTFKSQTSSGSYSTKMKDAAPNDNLDEEEADKSVATLSDSLITYHDTAARNDSEVQRSYIQLLLALDEDSLLSIYDIFVQAGKYV
jgi:hypothetical protein